MHKAGNNSTYSRIVGLERLVFIKCLASDWHGVSVV